MNTIVQLSNCQIVKSICDFTILLCSSRHFSPLVRGSQRGIVLYKSTYNETLSLQSPPNLPLLRGGTIPAWEGNCIYEVFIAGAHGGRPYNFNHRRGNPLLTSPY